MIIQPKIRGFICTTAHPEGCLRQVEEQIQYVTNRIQLSHPPKKVLIIGASTGYGLSSRIAAAFGAKAKTIGVSFERPADERRTASPGWYNTAAFERLALIQNIYAKSINGDAFSQAIKEKTVRLIQEDWQGEVDLVIYSIAAPRRTDENGKIYQSALKPINQAFTSKNIDIFSEIVSEINIPPASLEEIQDTIKVMGGEDWEHWITLLLESHCLAPHAIAIAYSYIGPELTYPIYHHGTIGRAKEHLEKTAHRLNKKLKALEGRAYISVNKAVVTQASAAIPVVPLYLALLFKVMKEKNLHEGCIEQMTRLFQTLDEKTSLVDEAILIRLDDWELQQEVQKEIKKRWEQITTDNVSALADLKTYRHEFYKLFGFDIPGIEYEMKVNPMISIPSLEN